MLFSKTLPGLQCKNINNTPGMPSILSTAEIPHRVHTLIYTQQKQICYKRLEKRTATDF